MAIAASARSSSSTMSHEEISSNNNKTNNNCEDHNHDDIIDHDQHEHDVVMPGFRFHPTEEELVEFYLRRKVEGKRFNVELITFLDLYRYDPWELPALAAIGEKEWFFYVPRDRKYRNGDRPNRVTTSGYWKATGADRMIRTEDFRSIGLKKTLVFYSGKAPKGIRTSWIMNEYRLPHHETERYQKAEISLCRVYKRAGVEDHPSLPRSLPSRASSSRMASSSTPKNNLLPGGSVNVVQTSSSSTDKFPTSFESQFHHHQLQIGVGVEATAADASATSSCEEVTTVLGLSKQNPFPTTSLINMAATSSLAIPASASTTPNCMEEDDHQSIILHKQQQLPSSSSLILPTYTSFFSPSNNSLDDLQKLIHYQQQHPLPSTSPATVVNSLPSQYYQPTPPPPPQQLALNTLPVVFSDRLWEWNPIQDATNPFK
ncbi:NAC domain-containing protein 35 [Benincasa hispida]|uniref:NAC domain-containing protein 35 n=1 Tax=Benincasa hispida TaxID=102211 RepID=UPI0018FFA551|nr:NAC domain-containing protein 35 [Benincasa hispida]